MKGDEETVGLDHIRETLTHLTEEKIPVKDFHLHLILRKGNPSFEYS